MGMRKSEILATDGVRVYHKQGLSRTQKWTIVGFSVLFLVLISLGLYAVHWKNMKEEAEALANAPEPPSYINQMEVLLSAIHSFTFTGTLSDVPLGEYLNEIALPMTQPYTEFYVDGLVSTNEISVNLYGTEENGEHTYLTCFIYNENGGYMEVGDYYRFYPDLKNLNDYTLVYQTGMDQATYIEIPNSAFTDRDYLEEYLLEMISNIRESADTRLATDTSKENSYSIQFSPGIFNQENPNLFTKICCSTNDLILSSVAFTDANDKHLIDVAFQQGNRVISLHLEERTEKYDNTMVYAVAPETLTRTISQMRTLYAQQVAEKDAAKEKKLRDKEPEKRGNSGN